MAYKIKKCTKCNWRQLVPYDVVDCTGCDNECQFGNSKGFGCEILICPECGHEQNIPKENPGAMPISL